MKYHNIQRIWTNPFYARMKKHICPGCGGQMQVSKRDAVLTPEQARVRGFRTDAIGKTRYIWDILECPGCGCAMSIEDMRKWEKERC